MKQLIIVIFVTLLCWDYTFAQSLDSLLAELIKNNPYLKGQKYRVQSNAALIPYSDNPDAPTLGLEISQIPFNTLNITEQSLSNSLTLTQMVPLGSMYSLRKNEAELLYEMNNLQYLEKAQMLKRELGLMYYELGFMRKQYELESKKIDVMKQQADLMASMLQVNMSKNTKYLQMISDIKIMEIERDNMLKETEIMQLTLNSMLGRKELNKAILTTIDTSLIEKQTMRESLVPIDLLMEQNKVAMLKNEVRMQEDASNPELMLSFMIMRMPRGMVVTTGNDMMMLTGIAKSEFMYSIMGSITLPFLPWVHKRNNSRVEAKEIELKSANQFYEAKSLEFDAEIQRRRKEYEAVKSYRLRLMNEAFPLIHSKLDNAVKMASLPGNSLETVYDVKVELIDLEIQINNLLKREFSLHHYITTQLEEITSREIGHE